MRKVLNAALAATLSLAMIAPNAIPIYADDIAEGTTVETSSTDVDKNEGSVGNNTGTINSNQGEVTTNEGTIVVNEASNTTAGAEKSLGTIGSNAGNVGTNDGIINTNLSSGTVGTNNYSGLIDVNSGTVNDNLGNRREELDPQTNEPTGNLTLDAGIHENAEGGVIKQNHGYVGTNNATIGVDGDDNSGNFDRVAVNNGTITQSGTNAQIGENNGTITLNTANSNISKNNTNGTVETNEARVQDNAGTVESNTGHVQNNERGGTITTNASSGTVSENGGTIAINNGTVQNNADYVHSTDSNGYDVWATITGTITLNNGTVEVNQGTITENAGDNSDGNTTSHKGEVAKNFGTIGTNNGKVSANFGTIEGGTGTVENNYGGTVAEGNTVSQQWWKVVANPVVEFGKTVSKFFNALFGGDDHDVVDTNPDVNSQSFNGNVPVNVDFVKNNGNLVVTPDANYAILGFKAVDGSGNELSLEKEYDSSTHAWTLKSINQNAEVQYATAPITTAEVNCGFTSGGKFAVGETTLRPGDFVSCGSIMKYGFTGNPATQIEDPENPGHYLSGLDIYGLYAIADSEASGGFVGEERLVLPTASGKKYRYDGVQDSWIRFTLVDESAEYEPVEEHPYVKPTTPKTEDKKDEDSKEEEKKNVTPSTPATTLAVSDPVLTTAVLSTDVPMTEPTAPSTYVETLAPTLVGPTETFKAVDMSGRPLSVAVSEVKNTVLTKAHTDFIETALKSVGVSFTSIKPAYTGYIASKAANSVMTLRVSTSKNAKVFVVFVDPVTGKKTYVKAKRNNNGSISFDVPFANAEFSVVEAK